MKGFRGLIFADHQFEYILFLRVLFFEDEYFEVNKRTAKSAKLMPLENHRVYGSYSY